MGFLGEGADEIDVESREFMTKDAKNVAAASRGAKSNGISIESSKVQECRHGD